MRDLFRTGKHHGMTVWRCGRCSYETLAGEPTILTHLHYEHGLKVDMNDEQKKETISNNQMARPKQL